MPHNLANRSADERRAIETHKAELFRYWQENKDRSYTEAARIFSGKEKKGNAWVEKELASLEHAQYRNMVRAEINRLQSGKPRE